MNKAEIKKQEILQERFKERCSEAHYRCPKCERNLTEIKRKQKYRIYGFFCLECDKNWIESFIKWSISIS